MTSWIYLLLDVIKFIAPFARTLIFEDSVPLLQFTSAPDAISNGPLIVPLVQFTVAPLVTIKPPETPPPQRNVPVTTWLPDRVAPFNVRFVIVPPWNTGSRTIVPPIIC